MKKTIYTCFVLVIGLTVVAQNKPKIPSISGLALKLEAPKDSWPTLYRSFTWERNRTSPVYCDLMTVKIGNKPAPKNSILGKDNTLVVTGDNSKTTFANFAFSPFTSFETDSKTFVLLNPLADLATKCTPGEISFRHRLAIEIAKRSGVKPDLGKLKICPAGIAFMAKSGLKRITKPGNLSGQAMKENWLLVWYGTRTPLPSPMMLILQRRPEQINWTDAGIELTFKQAAGTTVVLPLYAMQFPDGPRHETVKMYGAGATLANLYPQMLSDLANGTQNWKNEIPAEIVKRCQKLSRISRFLPKAVTETNSYNPVSGNVVITEKWQFVEIKDDWHTKGLKIAMLPPYLSLALRGKTPAKLSGKLLDLIYLVPAGRLAGVAGKDEVSVTIPKVSQYWRAKAGRKLIPNKYSRYQKLLNREIDKILAAGHLRPGYCSTGIVESWTSRNIGDYFFDYWANPADTIYTLCRALPLLDRERQGKVQKYMQNEFKNYPPYQISHIGWKDGAPREVFTLPPEVDADRKNFHKGVPTYFKAWKFPPQNSYAVSQYAKEFGKLNELYQACQKIAPEEKFEQSWAHGITSPCTGPTVLNSRIAGMIGLLQMAQATKDEAKIKEYAPRLAKMLLVKAAMLKYPISMKDAGCKRYGSHAFSISCYTPEEISFKPAYVGGDSSYWFELDFINLTPELGQFLHDYALAAAKQSVATYNQRNPYWFVAKAEETHGEGTLAPYYDRVALFQAKALILKEPAKELAKYLDVPACRVGDLFYIQNLCATIEAGK